MARGTDDWKALSCVNVWESAVEIGDPTLGYPLQFGVVD